MARLQNLPQDVLDHLLLCLPDFPTLAAALRSSRRLYDAGISHPRSIALAIAFNVAGPALPQAARLIHYTQDYETLHDEATVLDRPLNRHLCAILQDRAALVAKIEDLFSLRHKDRSSQISKLTGAESLRFRRALYRFWLYCESFLGDYEDDEDDDDWDDIPQPRNAAPLLESLPTDELLELERVANFLHEMCKWIITSSSVAFHADEISPFESAFIQGPEVIWEAYESNKYYPLIYIAGRGAVFKTQISQVLACRHVTDEEHEAKLSTAILDVVNGIDDVCHRCYGAQGVHLWGRSNWHLLRGFLSVGILVHMLDGNLPRNAHEIGQLRAHIQRRDPANKTVAFSWGEFLQELCDMDVDAEGPWGTDQWYCMDCVRHLLRTRLRKWWLATKTRLYGPLEEDCWYGFNCRTQVHRRPHAEKLNHLCEPTRGEGAVVQPH